MAERTRIVLQRLGLSLLATGAGLTGLSCGGGDITTPTTSSIAITTTTSGPEPDADGYAVSIDDGAESPLGANATLQRDDLDPGSHSVRLTGMADNCTVEGQNPRTVAVTGDAVAEVRFVITCRATTGSLEITSGTTGPSPDPDGYSITLDGTDRGTLGVSGAITLDGLTPGSHTIGLSGIAANCQVQGDNPQTATVTAGASATAAFAITCAAPPPNSGTLRITTSTTGPDPDADGYAVAVDGGTSQPIGINSTLTVSSLTPGTHSVALAGLVANCAVEGDNPRSVAIVADASTATTFTISCPTPAITRWTPMSSGTTNTLTDVSGSSANNVFVVDGYGTIRHYDGTSWSPQPAPAHVTAVWANSATDAFAVGGRGLGTFLHYDGRQWSSIPRPHSPCEEYLYAEWIAAVWGSSGTDVFAVGGFECEGSAGGEYIAHYDGTAWSRTSAMPFGELALSDVWGSSARDVYAVGLHSPSTPGEYDPDDDRAAIIHYDGNEWSRFFSEPNLYLDHIWASGASDVYATGETVEAGRKTGVVALWHFDGRSWSTLASPTTMPLGAIWGTSATDVYLLAGREIWHFDGAGWTKVHTSESHLADIWGSSSTDVYAVGENGTILHGTP